ncbi:MAG: hypothetical protein NT138_03305 [Planctomycetales bacterium]|nr:hypothetical protein [Planctomycetales bacterium]
MGTATTAGLIALGIVAIALIMSEVTKLTLRLMKRSLEARIAALYGPEDILMKDLAANNFGLESWGVWQRRGNGALVLTMDCLHFFRFVSWGDVRVPVESITEITFTKTHLGKATIYDLLKVRFAVDDKPDSIAWYLTDPKAWKSRIEELKAGKAAHERQ